MRKVNELIIRGEPAEIARFIERIEAASPAGWKGKPSLMPMALGNQYLKSEFTMEGGPELPASTIVLRKRNPGELCVSKVASAERKPLTEDEHNAILSVFAQGLRPVVEGIDVRIEILPFRVKMEDILDPEALHKLEQFTEAANKANLGPLDRLRWSRFVAQCHIWSDDLELDELDWWLRESGWPDEPRRQLVESYGEGRSLLKEYDEERVG